MFVRVIKNILKYLRSRLTMLLMGLLLMGVLLMGVLLMGLSGPEICPGIFRRERRQVVAEDAF